MTTPNTLLAAARLAYPDVDYWSALNGGLARFKDGYYLYFDPLTNPADLLALLNALDDRYISIYKHPATGKYHLQQLKSKPDDTDISCLSMTGDNKAELAIAAAAALEAATEDSP